MKRCLLFILLILFVTGCDLLNPCHAPIPQKWHIGKLEAELITRKPVLKVGDTIHFRFRLPQHIVDMDSLPVNIDLGAKVLIKITTTSNLNDTANSDFFATDTTIFKVFDKYFNLRVHKGRMINAYFFDCVYNENAWELEISYRLKKAGSYWAMVRLEDIYTSDLDQEERACMHGDTYTFGARLLWKESEFNQIGYLFNDDKEKYPDMYGFIVEP